MALDKTKLQKLDLSMTESTRAPSALDEMGSDEKDRMSALSGNAITSGKRSKAKPQHMRNNNSQAKNLRKAFVFQDLMTREEADAMSVEEVLAFREMHHQKRRTTSGLTKEKLEVLNDQRRNMLQEMVSFKGWIQAEMDTEIVAEEQLQARKKC